MFQGERIREIRNQRNMTIKELAEQTGLSSGIISQIERGIVDPTVSTFWKICNALQIPIQHFFHEKEDDEQVVRKEQRKILDLSDSNVRYYALNPSQTGKIQFLLVEIQPGQRTDIELVTHPGEECGFILQGQLSILLGNREILLNEGDSITFPSTTPHRYINRGNQVSLSIWAMV